MAQPAMFSVIVPTHKRAGLLERALSSIKAQQTTATCEVIVVADVIDPDTDRVCSELLSRDDIYVRRNGGAGPSESRNLGLSLAKGHYVLFLDDDDAWHPNCLEDFQSQPILRAGHAVYANCTIVKERRPPEGPEYLSEAVLTVTGFLTPDVYVRNQVHMSCFAFPRTLLEGITFDPYMRAYEDWEFLLSVFDRQMPLPVSFVASRVFEVDDETTDRRGSSQGASDYNTVLDYLYVYRRHPAPSEELKQKRSALLQHVGLPMLPAML